MATELVCANRPNCTYEVSSETPTAGHGFPSSCPLCGGDLKSA